MALARSLVTTHVPELGLWKKAGDQHITLDIAVHVAKIDYCFNTIEYGIPRQQQIPAHLPSTESMQDPVRTASLPMQSDSNAPSNQRLSSSYQLSDQFLQPHVDYSWENVTLDPQLVGGFGSQSFTSAWNDHSNNFGPPQQLSDHHETRSTSRIQPQSWEVFHGQAEPPLSHLEYSHPNVLLDFPPQTHAANTSLPYSIPSQCSTMHLPPYDSSSFPPLSCYSHSANIASQPDPRHLDQAALSNSRLSPSSATFDQRGFLNSIPTPSPPHHQFSLTKAQRFRLTQRQALRYDQTYTHF
ncbi:hypothetical protein JCM5350_001851 [Sporobolomyces pararoseus]